MRYNKHHPSLEDMSHILNGKNVAPIPYMVKNKILRAEMKQDPERPGDGFMVKYHFDLRDCDEFIRNTVHEVTENKSVLHKFAHDKEDKRVMSFSIDTWLPSYVNPQTDKPMTFDELKDDSKTRAKFLMETFKNIFANDFHNAVLEKVAIAKMAEDNRISPKEASVLYENQNKQASTVTKQRTDAEFQSGLRGKLDNFLKSLTKDKGTALGVH